MTIPDRMRAVMLVDHGGLDQLVYRADWPTPQPKPDEVLVKVGACGLNNTDMGRGDELTQSVFVQPLSIA